MQQNRAIIRLDSIRENARLLRSVAGKAKLCAVVKADAYGHGAQAVASVLETEADCFAVALVEEGVSLRVGGTDADILVMQPPLSEEEILRAVWANLIFTVSDKRDYEMLLAVLEKYNLCARCHLKVNTGMNRLGFDSEDFSEFCRGKLSDRILVEGIYSHLYMPSNAAVAYGQYLRFCDFVPEAEKTFGKLIKHLAATGGILADKRFCLDMVRPGIGLYGYLPEGFSGRLPLRKAMRVYSTVAADRIYRYGGAGYGFFDGEGELSCIRCGYADGFFRSGGIGNINGLCMDSFVSRGKKKYAEVCVFSDADEYAKKNGTISYEALVNVGTRSVRIYEG